jgi:hypothetical protein
MILNFNFWEPRYFDCNLADAYIHHIYSASTHSKELPDTNDNKLFYTVGLLISPSSLQSSTPMPWTLVVSHGHIS